MRWYRSLDLVTSEDVTDEYISRLRLSYLVSSGDLAGLYKDLYILTILSVSSSDNGYYWCQIINNQTCLSSLPYVNISVTTASTENSCFFDYQSNPVYAVCEEQSSSFSYITIPPRSASRLPLRLLEILPDPPPSLLLSCLKPLLLAPSLPLHQFWLLHCHPSLHY